MINGAESDAYQKGYNLTVSQSLGSVKKERNLIKFLSSSAIDGLIIGLCEGEQNQDLLLKLYKSGLPIMFVDRIPKLQQVHKVTSNHLESSINAVTHLIQKGNTRIAYFGSRSVDCVATDRFKGYIKALDNHHILYDQNLVQLYKPDKVGSKTLENIGKRIIAARPDAILIDDDRLGNEFLKTLKRGALLGTEQLAFACFTNSTFTELFDYQMTVVCQPAFQIGSSASEHLIDMISAKKPPESFHHVVINSHILFD